MKSQIQYAHDFGNSDLGKIQFWQSIWAAPAAPMTIIMLKGPDYGNPGLGKTSFLATYSQNTHGDLKMREVYIKISVSFT